MIPTHQHLIAAGVKPALADQWTKAVQVACAEFGIDTPKSIAAFLGQCAHETGGFAVLEENLNYSADTMAAVWPNRFAVLGPDKKPVKIKGKNQPNKFALALHRQPEAIANVVYSNRMGNGSIESGEGWLFRGRGLKQLTGQDNYKRCGQALGIELVYSPDLLLSPSQAARSAAWFYKNNKISEFADKWDLEGMTKKINGGLIGFEDRKKRCNAVLSCMA
jgi:putative chitinase